MRLRATKTQALATSGSDNGNVGGRAAELQVRRRDPDSRVRERRDAADATSGTTKRVSFTPSFSRRTVASSTPSTIPRAASRSSTSPQRLAESRAGDPGRARPCEPRGPARLERGLGRQPSLRRRQHRRRLGAEARRHPPRRRRADDVAFASGRAFVTLAANEDRLKIYKREHARPGRRPRSLGDDPRALGVTTPAAPRLVPSVLESGNRTTAQFTRWWRTAAGCRHRIPRATPGLGAAPSVGIITKCQPGNNRWEDETARTGAARSISSCRQRRLRDRRRRHPPVASSAPRPASARSSSTCRSTRHRRAVGVRTPRREHVVRFEPKCCAATWCRRGSHGVNAGTGAVTAEVDLNPPHQLRGQSRAGGGDRAEPSPARRRGVFTTSGTTYYVAAFGSGKVRRAERVGRRPTASAVGGGGPSGVALKERPHASTC